MTTRSSLGVYIGIFLCLASLLYLQGRFDKSDHKKARRLVQERDRLVQDTLVKGTDQQAAYELGASIDEYLDKLQVALRGS